MDVVCFFEFFKGKNEKFGVVFVRKWREGDRSKFLRFKLVSSRDKDSGIFFGSDVRIVF